MTAVKTVWGPAAEGGLWNTTTRIDDYDLNDADDAVAGLLCFPNDGTITHVGFYITTETGTSPAYNVGLVTVDASGFPTTTAYGGSTNTTAQFTSTGWKWVALAGNATANAGDIAAVYVWPTASAPDASNYISIANGGSIVGGLTGGRQGYTFSGAGAINHGGALFAAKYDSGAVVGVALSTNTLGTALTSATTPDEFGCVFTLPAAMTVNGIRTLCAVYGNAAAYDFIIYSAANAVLASVSVSDKDSIDGSNYIDVHFDAINLDADTTYRVIVKPTVGTNGGFTPHRYQFESAAAMAAWPHGDGTWQYTSRTDEGEWTNVSTDLMYIGLHVTDITFSTTSGGGGEFVYIG